MHRPLTFIVPLLTAIPLWAAAPNPKPGQPHPDFIFPAIDDGRPIALSQFRGQKVLLIEFASW